MRDLLARMEKDLTYLANLASQRARTLASATDFQSELAARREAEDYVARTQQTLLELKERNRTLIGAYGRLAARYWQDAPGPHRPGSQRTREALRAARGHRRPRRRPGEHPRRRRPAAGLPPGFGPSADPASRPPRQGRRARPPARERSRRPGLGPVRSRPGARRTGRLHRRPRELPAARRRTTRPVSVAVPDGQPGLVALPGSVGAGRRRRPGHSVQAAGGTLAGPLRGRAAPALPLRPRHGPDPGPARGRSGLRRRRCGDESHSERHSERHSGHRTG